MISFRINLYPYFDSVLIIEKQWKYSYREWIYTSDSLINKLLETCDGTQHDCINYTQTARSCALLRLKLCTRDASLGEAGRSTVSTWRISIYESPIYITQLSRKTRLKPRISSETHPHRYWKRSQSNRILSKDQKTTEHLIMRPTKVTASRCLNISRAHYQQ